jgi:predicted metal-binding protein
MQVDQITLYIGPERYLEANIEILEAVMEKKSSIDRYRRHISNMMCCELRRLRAIVLGLITKEGVDGPK